MGLALWHACLPTARYQNAVCMTGSFMLPILPILPNKLLCACQSCSDGRKSAKTSSVPWNFLDPNAPDDL